MTGFLPIPMHLAVIVLLNVLQLTPYGADAYSCKTPTGADVDWFFIYKLPDENGRGKDDGSQFLYVDSQSKSGGWVRSSEPITSPTSSVGQTVSQLFLAKQKKNANLDFYALYNDEDPNTNKTSSSRGHMKGVLIFDDFEGVWLVHSTPLFPSTQHRKYFYPESGKRNGQTFLCVTFPTTSLNDIGIQLQFGQPPVYEKQMPDSYVRLYPNLAEAINGKRLPRKSQGYHSVKVLTSKRHQSFTSFQKHKNFAKDLYADLVAPNLRSSLYVETWLNGPNDLPSDCNVSYQVYNLRSVRPFTYNFKSSKDHSKWAVSTESRNPWICVGDINRQKSQEHRGGGTLCLNSAEVSQLFRLSVGDVECCGRGDNNNNNNNVDATRVTSTNEVKSDVYRSNNEDNRFLKDSNNNNNNDDVVVEILNKNALPLKLLADESRTTTGGNVSDSCVVMPQKEARKRNRRRKRKGGRFRFFNEGANFRFH